jgi:SEC-C motif-containing protein
VAKLNKKILPELCPCGSTKKFIECCSRYLENIENAPSAEALMRSRYTAFTLQREDYLLATWHKSTRPQVLGLAEDVNTKWIGLVVKRHEQQNADHAIVEFVASFKVNGRATKLHEVSSFVREEGKWIYVDGDLA